jgi:hypothetical protein
MSNLVQLKLGCKECGEISFQTTHVPVTFSFWKCPICEDTRYNPMLIGISEVELPELKDVKNNYSFEVGV